MQMRKRWLDAYDGMCFFGGLVFFAPVALLIRTQAEVTEAQFSCCRLCSARLWFSVRSRPDG